MKNDFRLLLIFVGIGFLILGAMLRSASDFAWEAKESSASAARLAKETENNVQWLRSKVVANEWKLDSIAKWQQLLNQTSSNGTNFSLMMEIKSEILEEKVALRMAHEEVMRRLNEIPPYPQKQDALDELKRQSWPQR